MAELDIIAKPNLDKPKISKNRGEPILAETGAKALQ